MSEQRAFTNDTEPPTGERLTLVDETGTVIVWTGKRWYDPLASDGSLQTRECWPPHDLSDGPWHVEVVEGIDTP